MAKKEKRFLLTHEENSFATSTTILVDRETGVNYLFHASGTGGGLTVLLDREGRPVVTTVLSCDE